MLVETERTLFLTEQGERMLARIAVALSTFCLTGLAIGLVQWGAWGAELDTVQQEQKDVEQQLMIIQRDIRGLDKKAAVSETILRGLAEKAGVHVPRSED